MGGSDGISETAVSEKFGVTARCIQLPPGRVMRNAVIQLHQILFEVAK